MQIIANLSYLIIQVTVWLLDSACNTGKHRHCSSLGPSDLEQSDSEVRFGLVPVEPPSRSCGPSVTVTTLGVTKAVIMPVIIISAPSPPARPLPGCHDSESAALSAWGSRLPVALFNLTCIVRRRPGRTSQQAVTQSDPAGAVTATEWHPGPWQARSLTPNLNFSSRLLSDQQVIKDLSPLKSQKKLCEVQILFWSVENAKTDSSVATISRLILPVAVLLISQVFMLLYKWDFPVSTVQLWILQSCSRQGHPPLG